MVISYSFDIEIEEETVETNEKSRKSLLLPSLTADIIYCPKCGTINSFKENTFGELLNYFCERCGVRVNNYWDEYHNGKYALVKCERCQEYTFDRMKYCTVCGAIQSKVAKKRAEYLSSKIKDSRSKLVLEGQTYSSSNSPVLEIILNLLERFFTFLCCKWR